MAIATKPIGTNQGIDGLVKKVRETFEDLEDQLNTRAQVYTSTDGRIPAGLNRNDILIISYRGQISLLIRNKTGFDYLTAEMLDGMPKKSTQFLGKIVGTAAVTLASFPVPNDWGFFHNSTGGTFHLCYNLNNTLQKVAM